MKRFFFATVFMILAVGFGWRVAPPSARERMLGFIGVANRADPARVVQDIKEKIIPEDPAARRAALMTELKQKIQQIKTESAGAANANTDGASAAVGAPAGAPVLAATSAARAAAVASSADEAVQIINQLEQSGSGASASGQIVQRLIERLLPAPQCKP